MTHRHRVLVVGLGPIGLAVADEARCRKSMELVGVVDTDPGLRGRDLGELLGRPQRFGLPVEADLGGALERHGPDAILLCTSAFLAQVKTDILRAVRGGVDVVSSCEELLLPDLQFAASAREIDEAAHKGGATVVGTGVNPGFVLDYVPIVASAVCSDLKRVTALRVVDAATRRMALQRKVGAGLTVAEFHEQLRGGGFGHIGMRESVALVGRALGLELDGVCQTVEPMVADDARRTAFFTVARGQVAGIRNLGLGTRDGDAVVELDLQMYVGARDPRDEVWLDARPPIHLRFEGGVAGDEATANILVNTVAQVVAAPPGLKTILDLPPPRLSR